MQGPSKTVLLGTLRQQLADDLRTVKESQRLTQEGATHPENRPENSKDMRSTEVSYVARGLAQRVEDLQTAVAALAVFVPRSFTEEDAIGLGALVTLSDEEENESLYFLVPAGGGVRVTVGGQKVRTLTPDSPLGEALIGLRVEEEVELPGGKARLRVAGLG